jgi:hypothetical protein
VRHNPTHAGENLLFLIRLIRGRPRLSCCFHPLSIS